MSTSVASDLVTTRPSRGGATKKLAIVGVKLLVTAACFWYLSRQVDTGQVLSAVRGLDFRWAAFATAVVMLQIPLVELRWCNIVDELAARSKRITPTIMVAVTAIGMFFAQVLPSVAGEGGGCPAFLLNIEKRSLPRLMLSGDGLASKDAV